MHLHLVIAVVDPEVSLEAAIWHGELLRLERLEVKGSDSRSKVLVLPEPSMSSNLPFALATQPLSTILLKQLRDKVSKLITVSNSHLIWKLKLVCRDILYHLVPYSRCLEWMHSEH